MGVWALAHDARILDDRRLCAPACTVDAVAVWHLNCTGLCAPERSMREVQEQCARLAGELAPSRPSPYYPFPSLNGLSPDTA